MSNSWRHLKLLGKALSLLVALVCWKAGANDDLFAKYVELTRQGQITPANAEIYLKELESDFFKKLSRFFDETDFSEQRINYIAVEDNLRGALLDWSRHAENNQLAQTLEELARDGRAALENRELQVILKKNRKLAHLSRITFYVFDKKHAAPKELESFTKSFGKLNDAIASGDRQLVENHAHKTLKKLGKFDTDKTAAKFVSVNKSEMSQHFRKMRESVEDLLQRNSHSVDDFHWLRKRYKQILTVYYNLDTYNPPKKSALLNSYISQLGELNDIYTDLHFRFGLDLSHYKTKFPISFKEEVSSSMRFLEEDLQNIYPAQSCASFFMPKF